LNTGIVIAVARISAHQFSKEPQPLIQMVAGLGVEGDAHQGSTVKHRSRVARDPAQPNLRQVHLIHDELLDELRAAGFAVEPGELGENVTTRGVDLLGLPVDTRLRLGPEVVIQLTGLRNPCVQLDRFQPGLLGAVLDRAADGRLIRKSGVMSIVLTGGVVRPGDAIAIEFPDPPHRMLDVV
jgi:MOSC domain-containing protein YiiM